MHLVIGNEAQRVHIPSNSPFLVASLVFGLIVWGGLNPGNMPCLQVQALDLQVRQLSLVLWTVLFLVPMRNITTTSILHVDIFILCSRCSLTLLLTTPSLWLSSCHQAGLFHLPGGYGWHLQHAQRYHVPRSWGKLLHFKALMRHPCLLMRLLLGAVVCRLGCTLDD